MALKDAKLLYTDLSVYDRTFIEMMQAIIASGNYAPGPLIVQLAEDATRGALSHLGYDLPIMTPIAHEWTVWKN